MTPRQTTSTLAAVVDFTASDLSHSIVWLPVAKLSFEPKFNRVVNERRVAQIAEHFDPDFVGTITVSHRTAGTYVIIDGQHRVRAMRQMGWGDQSVECRVYTGLAVAEEARLFRGLNTMSKPQAIDVFRARVVEGEPIACAIQKILAASGFKVAQAAGPGMFAAVSAAEKVYTGKLVRKSGTFPNELRAALHVLGQAYGVDASAVKAMLVEGVALIFFRYGSAVDIPALIKKLAVVPGAAQGLIGSGKSLQTFRGGTLPDNIAEVIVGVYNKSRRTRALPEWRAA